MEIILDLGSGNTCRNDVNYLKRMIDEIARVDNHKHKIILKFQLFLHAPPNRPLDPYVFMEAGAHATLAGYVYTASVFDLSSLRLLMSVGELPFVKIANRRDLDWLIGEVPRKIPVYVSVSPERFWFKPEPVDVTQMVCVSKYPATIEEYHFPTNTFGGLGQAVSDHTIGFELIRRYKPRIWERHFVLEHDDKNPDGGPWAMTTSELKEALEIL